MQSSHGYPGVSRLPQAPRGLCRRYARGLKAPGGLMGSVAAVEAFEKIIAIELVLIAESDLEALEIGLRADGRR